MMNVIKMAFYMLIGIGCTWAHMMGHDVLLNVLFCVWLPVAAWEVSSYISPWFELPKQKGTNGRHR